MLRRVTRQIVRLVADSGLAVSVSAADHRGKPPTVQLRVGGDKIEVVEASWKELAPDPTFRKVAFWLAVVAPFTVIELIRAIPRRWSQFADESIASALSWLPGAVLLRFVVGGVLFPVWFVPLLIATALSRFVPDPNGKAALNRLQSFFSSVLGDSFLFVDDPTVRVAIVNSVREQILETSERCERITLLGHSQGSHIAMAAIEQLSPEIRARTTLVTWGSGYRKLSQLSLVTDAQPASGVQGALPILGLPLLALSIAWADGAWTLAAFGVLALLLLAWWIFRVGARYDLETIDPRYMSDLGVEWHDVWATHDIVPDGALFVGSNSVSVTNTGSLLGDHSRYHTNPHVLVLLLSELSDTFAENEKTCNRPETVRASWHRAANRVTLSVVAVALLQYWFRGFTHTVGILVLAGPYIIWSRLELMWRLRRRHQLVAGRPKTLAQFWISDSSCSRSYTRLANLMPWAIVGVLFLGPPVPAAFGEGFRLGVTAGWGSGLTLLSSLGFYSLVVTGYSLLRLLDRLFPPTEPEVEVSRST